MEHDIFHAVVVSNVLLNELCDLCGRRLVVVVLNIFICMAHWSIYDNSRTTERVENRDLFMIIVGPPRGSSFYDNSKTTKRVDNRDYSRTQEVARLRYFFFGLINGIPYFPPYVV